MSSSEIMVIVIAALLLFGGRRLPALARTWGRIARDFRRTLANLKREIGIDLDEPPEEKEKPPGK